MKYMRLLLCLSVFSLSSSVYAHSGGHGGELLMWLKHMVSSTDHLTMLMIIALGLGGTVSLIRRLCRQYKVAADNRVLSERR